MKFGINDLDKVKLVIWDLDETFWHGTLSENGMHNKVQFIPENIELVKQLSYRGIVNSICSKNNLADVERVLLQADHINDYFVFNSINWEPKGQRMKKTIEAMSLRAINVLFLDDNPANLAEAEFVMPEIMVSGPEIIPQIIKKVGMIGKDDKNLSRLTQYKVLERKRKDANEFSSNIDFLRHSGIRVCIKNDCNNVSDRIAELIQRTNQLNFTKNRMTAKEVRALINDSSFETGYVMVEDNYGYYGIVGFYAMKENSLMHFLFSCRTMGMGIEQFVYAYLGYPNLTIIEPVSGNVNRNEGKPDYISLVDSFDMNDEDSKMDVKILLKGPCDLQVMASYLEGINHGIYCEFNFVDSNDNQQDFYNHTANILNSKFFSSEYITQLTQKYPFLSREAFETTLYTIKYDIICLSPLMDATLAVYRNRLDGTLLPFGLYSRPITEEDNWADYISKSIMTARSNFTVESLKSFKEEYEEIEYTPVQIVDNIEKILHIVSTRAKETYFVILLLAELPFEGEESFFSDKEKKHIAINNELRKRFDNNPRVYLLDVNKYIKKQSDYFDTINHYSKYVYYKMALELADYANSRVNMTVKTKSKFLAWYMNIRRTIYKKLVLKK